MIMEDPGKAAEALIGRPAFSALTHEAFSMIGLEGLRWERMIANPFNETWSIFSCPISLPLFNRFIAFCRISIYFYRDTAGIALVIYNTDMKAYVVDSDIYYSVQPNGIILQQGGFNVGT